MSEEKNEQNDYREPPKTLGRILASLGPGMIIAGSIVGSGELIATTKVGAEAGFWLLWLIILGCVIKVFAQVEFGRHTITHSESPLKALNQIPGPSIPVKSGRRANWILLGWACMVTLIVCQQGGIVGAIGQSLSMTMPITEKGKEFNTKQNALIQQMMANRQNRNKVEASEEAKSLVLRKHKAQHAFDSDANEENKKALQGVMDNSLYLSPQVQQLLKYDAELSQLKKKRDSLNKEIQPSDAVIYAGIMAVLTTIMLLIGRYGLVEHLSMVLVGGFTLVTLVTLFLLQRTEWAISGQEFVNGLSFQLTPEGEGLSKRPVETALATFGIIGVGAMELVMYPYWCLEKGYAKYTGTNDGSESWIARAKGWVRILYFDAWGAMLVYTFSTIAFFLLGAAVLGRIGLNPGGSSLIRTLSQMYAPVFGNSASLIFLIGAFAVLFSTFFIAAAGCARMISDACGLFGFHKGDEESKKKWTTIISAIWPLFAFAAYMFFQAPAAMVLASGTIQAIVLPLLGLAALYFRYKRSDKRLTPGKVWDVFLWLSVIGFMIAGGYQLYAKLLA